jgi:VWFA-related protein
MDHDHNLLRRLQTFPRRRHTLPTPAYSKEIAYRAMIRFLTMINLGHTRLFRAMLSCAVLLIVFAVGVSAQQPDDTIVVNTALVQLNVGVVDRQGHAITTLTRNDFTVYEDGVLRPIATFEPTETPFSLVMLLDMSGSTINFRQQIQQAALRFLDALAPDDRVAVVEFNGKGVKSLLGFGTDRRRTAYAITLATGAGTTPLYDALKYSLEELGREGKRRKAIVVLTDGIDTKVQNADRAIVQKAAEAEVSTAIRPEANSQLNSVLNDADRQGVAIFPLALPSGDPKHLPMPDPLITAMYAAARSRLELLANRTGGQLHEVRRLDELAKIYPIIAAEMRSLYTIAYRPQNPGAHDGKWREIRIEVAHAELVARTKPGYYAR